MTKIDNFMGEFRFLSNFWPCLGSDTERLYQAAKATNDEDRAKIMAAKGPRDARRLGQKIKMRADWDDVKVPTMRDLIARKFADPELREALLATGDAVLIEGNWWGDKFWGVCGGVGKNWLGRLLMCERARIRGEAGHACDACA